MEARLGQEGQASDSGRDRGAGRERDQQRPALAWLQIAAWYVVSRAVVLVVSGVIQAGDAPSGHLNPRYLTHPLGLLGAWDGNWYRFIAVRGYLDVPGHENDTAFFPLFPVLVSALHGVGISTYAAGVVLANALFLVGLIVFYELGRTLLPEIDARRAAIYAAIFPIGFVFSMEYPESLAFVLIAAAALLAARGRWLACAICGAGAALARPEGLFVLLPLAVLAWRAWPRLETGGRARAVAAVLAAPAAWASFWLYLWWVTGTPFATRSAEEAWGRELSITGVARSFRALGVLDDRWLLRDALLCFFYIACLAVAARAGIGRAWIAFGLLIVLVPLASGSFVSEGRFGLLALPVFWGLATLGRHAWVDFALRVSAPLLLALATVSLVYTPP